MSGKRQRYRGHYVTIACDDVPMSHILNAADELSNASWDFIYAYAKELGIERDQLTGIHGRIWAAVKTLREVMPK